MSGNFTPRFFIDKKMSIHVVRFVFSPDLASVPMPSEEMFGKQTS